MFEFDMTVYVCTVNLGIIQAMVSGHAWTTTKVGDPLRCLTKDGGILCVCHKSSLLKWEYTLGAAFTSEAEAFAYDRPTC
jgi:hypothetical protein